MISTVSHLTQREIEGINAYASALIEWLEYDLVGLWLFGSKARGDFGPYSDIDLLIVVKELSPKVQWQIREMAADYSLEYDVIFNTHILDSADWAQQARWRDTLWREVERDGIVLSMETRLLQSR